MPRSCASVSLLVSPPYPPNRRRPLPPTGQQADADPNAGIRCVLAGMARFASVFGSRPGMPCSNQDSTAAIIERATLPARDRLMPEGAIDPALRLLSSLPMVSDNGDPPVGGDHDGRPA